jgi:hypothetical protein
MLIARRTAYIAQGDNMPVRSSLFPANAMRAHARIATVLITLTVFAACTDKSGPTAPTGFDASRNGVPFDVGLASPAWQARAAALIVPLGPIPSGHSLGIVGVAQYLAVQRAEAAIGGAGGRQLLETDRGAVAGASAAVLTAMFPTLAQSFEDMVTAQANAGPGNPHPGFLTGEAIGRAVGAALVASRASDGFSIFNDPPPPVGPAFWVSNAVGLPVAGGQLPGVTRWFPLAFATQFRPGPHPAFGSTEFNASLARIRDLSDNRNQAQIDTAALWAPRAAGYWLGVASQETVQRGLSEREATHLYALLSATMADAMIGCWDGKLTYWLIRPWKADPAITTTAAVGKPNHPSYPSGHSCISASAASVLTSFFPDMGPQLDAMVLQAGRSRMYGGLHYDFDISAGQNLGRNTAAFTMAADASGHSILTAH